jgi:DNA-binding transcriptional MocR family regulator
MISQTDKISNPPINSPLKVNITQLHPSPMSHLLRHLKHLTAYVPKMPPFTSSLSTTSTAKHINLLRGWPNPSLLPAAQLQAASQTALSSADVFIPGLLYGPDPGFQPLRESIVAKLDAFYRPAIRSAFPELRGREEGKGTLEERAERICITGGASQNLANVLLVYSDPAVTTIWLVAPCYFMACNIFDDAGVEMRAVGEGEEGIDLEALERGFKEADKSGKKVCACFSFGFGGREVYDVT